MYKKLLIANRGECAVRLLRSCEALGIETVLCTAYDENDSLAAELADDCVATGWARDAYENEDNILEALRLTQAQGILCGYGFLAENAIFAMRCRRNNQDFVGPSVEHLELFGDKSRATGFMAAHGIPHNAYSPPLGSLEEALAYAEAQGFPLMLKSRFGGGGKGIFPIEDAQALTQAWQSHARLYSPHTFYLERAMLKAKHIEFQYVGDAYGQGMVYGARDCSFQHRRQKWIEFSVDTHESPMLNSMAQTLEALFRGLRYVGLATIEFLQDEKGSLYFLEVNPRLQVEHGVTEGVYGVDLVELLLRASCQERLNLSPKNADGFAIEARIYAQSTGVLKKLHWPALDDAQLRLRIDAGYQRGDAVSARFDGLIAKLIVHGPDERMATRGLIEALERMVIDGVATNAPALLGKLRSMLEMASL